MPVYIEKAPISNSDLIHITDTANNFSSDNVEGALAEVGNKLTDTVQTDSDGNSTIKGAHYTNVFDYTQAISDYYASNYDANGDVIITSRVGSCYSEYIPVKQGDAYIAHNALGGLTDRAMAIIFNANKKGIRRMMPTAEWDNRCYFTIADANAAYMIVNLNIAFTETISQLMVISGTVWPFSYIAHGITHYDNFILKPEANEIEVVLPKYIYGIKGEECRVYNRGVIKCVDPSHYYIYRDSGQTNVRYSYFPTTTAVSNQGGKKLTVKDQITGKIIAAKTSSSGLYITDPATKSNPLSVKNILVIGDSTTDSDTWVDEFGRRLTGAGGSPAGYEWTNYNFIGTNTDGTYNHEGRSGWTFEDFAYAPDDATHGRSEVTTNPFWNSGTASLDFAKYMTDNSFSGDIDYCVILLGWNDGLSLARTATTVGETAELFIDALHADYPNCKVLLCGINTSSPYPFNGTTLIPPYSLNKYALELAKVYDALASDATYSTFVKYVPVTACFDAEYGMQHSNVVANARTAETIRTCTDLIHPGASGYLQIADIVLATFLTLV